MEVKIIVMQQIRESNVLAKKFVVDFFSKFMSRLEVLASFGELF